MPNTVEMQALTRNDPIWKRLRVERILKLLFLILLVAFLPFALKDYWRTMGPSSIFFVLFILFGPVTQAFNQFHWERYWRRIGQRRIEAMQQPELFPRSVQPVQNTDSLSLPATMSLRWNRMPLITIGALFLVLVLVPFPLLLFQRGHVSTLLFFAGFLLFLFLFMAVLFYFVSFRYQPQTIEITQEGIKTRYMHQECHLRWDEARLFATYGAQGVRKSSQVQTYELANERTVVHWSQQTILNFFLTPQSNVGKKEDWNWLIGQVNTLAAARTGLPLLDLGDAVQTQLRTRPLQQEVSTSKQETPSTSSPIATPIAQNDPLVQRLQFRGEMRNAIAMLGIFSIGAIVAGILDRVLRNNQSMKILPGNSGLFLLVMGFLLLVILLPLIGTLVISQKYWRRIGQARLEALRQPHHYQAKVQPVARAELPQPVDLRLQRNRALMWTIAFVESFIMCFLFAAILFKLSLLALVISSLVFSLIMSFLFLPIFTKAGEQRVSVTTEGISTRLGNVDSYMRWQDVRLFSTYSGLRLFNRPTRTYTYELASEETVVRWQQSRSRFQIFIAKPKMSREELEHWRQQLHGYVVERTHLALMDLDRPVTSAE